MKVNALAPERLYQVTTSTFCQELVVSQYRVIRAASELRGMLGWTVDQVFLTCHKRRWLVRRIA